MNKQQLASRIWEAANKMRSKIEANEYKDYILGFIFYKYLSDKEVEFLISQGASEEDLLDMEDSKDFIQKEIGYYISYENLFSTWLKKGNDFTVSNVTDALSAFERNIIKTHKKVYEDIFNTLQTGLSKLGDSSGAQTKAIRGLIELIKDIPMNGKQDYDVLGFIYEYLISMFAANAGKKAGEFYTPHEVAILMSEIVANHLKNRETIEIFDPTSGSGSLLITIGKSVGKYMTSKGKIKYYAQELKENTYNLTRMNLVMRGINPSNIKTRCADTLADDWPYFDENQAYSPLSLDAVVSNPPYSQPWDPTDKEGDPRYARYGVAPKSKADYAFLLHDLFHIKNDGIMTIVLPHGVLFRGGEEEKIRRNLIENNNIDAIIGLPPNIFFGTGIPTIIMVLKKSRPDTDVMIIDASKGFEKVGKNNKLRSSDIKRVVDVLISRATVDKFSKLVSKEEISKNEYNLNIPRYVDSSEDAESWDIYASIFGGIPCSEIDKFEPYWNQFPNLKAELFNNINESYRELKVNDLTEAVMNSENVSTFNSQIKNSLSQLPNYLSATLIDNMMAINAAQEESVISDEIFKCFNDSTLIDKYAAYQILDDDWNKISGDLEILQSEGFEAIKKVDPKMVTKNDVEIQEGYIGHVLPFELIQRLMMASELNAVKQKEERLQEITSTYAELLESLTDEDKDCDLFNEERTAFVNSEIKKEAKKLAKYKDEEEEGSLNYVVLQ
ncbi:MAG: type I restriction-modification system subunit M, partial [Bacteroidales bacterium]|nr:type I restriction-modification system subunit M [Bacteroidales bacterium]